MTPLVAIIVAAAGLTAIGAVASPRSATRVLASAALLVAALFAATPATGLPSWCVAVAAGLWWSAPSDRRPWLAVIAQLSVVGVLLWGARDGVAPAAVTAASLCAGSWLVAAALQLAPASPLFAVLALTALVVPGWSPAEAGPTAIDVGEGLATVAGSAMSAPALAISAWQWLCALALALGLATSDGRARTACLSVAAVTATALVAQAAPIGPWAALDIALRAAAIAAIWPRANPGMPTPPLFAADTLLRLAALAVAVVAVLWAAQLSAAAGPTLAHDPRAWALAATAVALLGAALRPAQSAGSVSGASAAALIACAAALVGGSVAGWTVTDLAQVHAR